MRHKDPELKKRIKEYCEQYYLKNAGRSPSVRTIGTALDISYVTVFRYINAMADEGMVSLKDGKICTAVTDKMAGTVTGIPVCGGMFGGKTEDFAKDVAEDAVEEITDYVSIPKLFLDDGQGDYFILIMTGNSMVDAGIDSGDCVILRRTTCAQDGQIMAVLLDGRESTLKRYLVDEGETFLWAENDDEAEWSLSRRYIPLGDKDSI